MIQANVNKSYEGLDYQPKKKAHGTHVMDIAAGNGKYPGIAPEADLIFVHLGLPSPIEVEKEFLGSSIKLYQAVEYIFNKANMEGKTAVVNISLASNGGPHDGTSLLERMFDDLLDDKEGRALVIGAGNSYKVGIHTKGSIESTTVSDFHWTINQHVSTNNPSKWGQRQEMEIWYESQDSLILNVFDPNGQPIGSCKRDDPPLTMSVADFPEPVVLIYHSFDEEANENHINIFIDDRYSDLELGDYRFRLEPSSSHTDAVEYHAWIEENKAYPSRFANDDQEPSFTINSIANAKLPIVVGAYDNLDAAKTIYWGSSSGPSRNSDALKKPEISAPGVNIYAARALFYGSDFDGSDGSMELSGTSQAAPHVSGVIALMFETARDFCDPPKKLNISQIRQILIDTADRDPPQGAHGTHHPQFGLGRINCSEALNQVLA
jgi:subtilisin family serine protease